jgi:HD-GYP domain-containing protein (c-di-GMP phosphodiesterase class II)
MRKTAIILYLLIIAGCKTPSSPPPLSRFDIAIENLSRTSQQLEDLRKEKDLFVKSLENFERQKAEHVGVLDANDIDKQTKFFAEWHRDIAQREKDITIEHSMNVSAAHREIAKRRATEPNQAAFSTLFYRNP